MHTARRIELVRLISLFVYSLYIYFSRVERRCHAREQQVLRQAAAACCPLSQALSDIPVSLHVILYTLKEKNCRSSSALIAAHSTAHLLLSFKMLNSVRCPYICESKLLPFLLRFVIGVFCSFGMFCYFLLD
jgi:hypothetical protein